MGAGAPLTTKRAGPTRRPSARVTPVARPPSTSIFATLASVRTIPPAAITDAAIARATS